VISSSSTPPLGVRNGLLPQASSRIGSKDCGAFSAPGLVTTVTWPQQAADIHIVGDRGYTDFTRTVALVRVHRGTGDSR
jgi:hypothetical protein